MNLLDRYNNFISKFSKVRDFLIFLIITIELGMMLYEKTDLPISSPSYVFRVTFLLTMIVLLLTEYDLKQWVAIVVTGIFGVISYKITGNNDLLRLGMFVIACKDINLEKLLRYICAVSTVGSLAIFLASVTGIYGKLANVQDYGRGDKNELRYVFGFGHPNTVHGSFFALVLLYLYLGRNLKKNTRIVMNIVLLALNWVLGEYTGSRTGFVATAFAIIIATVSIFMKKEKQYKWPYILSAVYFLFAIAISIAAAAVSPYVGDKLNEENKVLWKINQLVTGRIWTLYADSKLHKGSLQSWKLFGDEFSGEYFFDMGWVRVFYWYGIIPAVIIMALVLAFIYILYKKQEIDMLVMFVSVITYTIVEAAFISSYIGRDYMLPVAGVYLLGGLSCREKTSI